MGTAVSTLTSEQKAEISRSVRQKYAELDLTDSNNINDDTIKQITGTVELSISQIKTTIDQTSTHIESNLSINTEPPTPALDSIDPSIVEGPPTIEKSLREESDADITSDSNLNNLISRAMSTEQLLKQANSFIMNNAKVANFISQLKEGDISTRRASGFRIRRLTYAQKTAEEPEKPQVLTAKRTTIYASKEIGVRQERVPPFPPMILGTFSCHGIEPAHQDDDQMEEDGQTDGDGNNEYEDDIVEKTNQDRGCVVHPFNHSYNESLFMVLDGHGEQGDRVAEFCMRNIVIQVEKNLAICDSISDALVNSFVMANAALVTTPIKYMTSGCTCVAVYIVGDEYWVANCGDSRAVLASWSENGDLVAQNLSRDHKPDDPEEMARISEWGGFVCLPPIPELSARVYLDPEFTMIGLAMARSLGDYAVKNVGVIPTPEVIKYELRDHDKFMILASDGVWEFISSQEAVDIVHQHLALGAHFACQQLIQTAAARWQEEEGNYRDDITAIVLTFPLPAPNPGAVETPFERSQSADED